MEGVDGDGGTEGASGVEGATGPEDAWKRENVRGECVYENLVLKRKSIERHKWRLTDELGDEKT